MTITKFISTSGLIEKPELIKIKLFAYYDRAEGISDEFTTENIEEWFTQRIKHSLPNIYRIKNNLLKSTMFVKGIKKDSFKLNAKVFLELENEFKLSETLNEEIETINSILPESLYKDTRGYIESLSKQINASYENNICDGCAVLMRRLLEILLILSYQKKEIESSIKNADGSYKMLDGIINDAVTNTSLALSKDSRAILHDFKELGNFSAHKIHYNCRKSEITIIARKYRASIEELFYKTELK